MKFRNQQIQKQMSDKELSGFFKPVTETLKERLPVIKQEWEAPIKIISSTPKQSPEWNEDSRKRSFTEPAFQTPTYKRSRILSTTTPVRPQEREDTTVNTSTFIEDQSDTDVEFAKNDLEAVFRTTLPQGRDEVFGLRLTVHGWQIGNKIISMNPSSIEIEGREYPLTPGLIELLVDKESHNYNPEELSLYSDILRQTNAMHQNDDPSFGPRSNKGAKWSKIVRHIWTQTKEMREKMDQMETVGEGLKRVDSPCQVYVTDVNQLIFRLRDLLGLQRAGNRSHQTEIISIADELRKKGIINQRQYLDLTR